MIKSKGVHVWRVSDMLDSFDQSEAARSVQFPPRLRRWAANAHEYVCWDGVPREALVAFAPWYCLFQNYDRDDDVFLTEDFKNSTSLSDFRRRPLESLSLKEYAGRASSFVRRIVLNEFRGPEVRPLALSIARNWLLEPSEWGYHVPGSVEKLEDDIMSAVEEALEGLS
ncbi:hypothetical protein VTK56DRAFT_9598 [Thermocarpiscus australiensis]